MEEQKHEREYQEWLALSEEEKDDLFYLSTLDSREEVKEYKEFIKKRDERKRKAT